MSQLPKTPNELAAELGISPKTLRAFLRRVCPRSDAEKHQRWILSERHVRKAREHFA